MVISSFQVSGIVGGVRVYSVKGRCAADGISSVSGIGGEAMVCGIGRKVPTAKRDF